MCYSLSKSLEVRTIKGSLYTGYLLYHILLSLLLAAAMIYIKQTIIVVFFCKNIFHKSWVEIVLCFENLYHKQLQVAFKRGYRIIHTYLHYLQNNFHYLKPSLFLAISRQLMGTNRTVNYISGQRIPNKTDCRVGLITTLNFLENISFFANWITPI